MQTAMGDLVPQADSVKQEPSSPGGTPQKDSTEAGEPKTGPIKCGKCSQVYAGPSSLKRHLWRIHRLAGDEAQALVDASVAEATGEESAPPEKKPACEEQGDSDSQSSGGGGGSSSDVKPLLAVSLSSSNTMVRPLLSLSPDPPGYQSNNFGGVSPTAPWSHQGLQSGASVPQSGLLPTPGGGNQGGMMPLQTPAYSPDPAPGGEGSDGEQGSKIKPLMSVGMGGGGEGGIQPLMSLPVMGVTPFMLSGGMGGGYQYRMRRKERRAKPYQPKDSASSRQDQGDQNGGDRMDSEIGPDEEALLEDDGAGYSEGVQICGECGAQFEDSAALADHELAAHNVSIDLNCDVELTA